MKKALVAMGLLMGSTSAMAANFPPAQQAMQYLPKGEDVALLVADANSGKILYEQRANKLQPPASTQKLLTSLAATLELGRDFRFQTKLETQGNNVIIQFGGDPSFTREDLMQLLEQLPSNGITSIHNVYLNGGVFDGYERQPGLPWDTLTACYAAPASSITVGHNCVEGALYSAKSLGDLTQPYVPSFQPVTVSSSAITVSPTEKKDQFCRLGLEVHDNNHYNFTGCMVQRSTPLPLNFAVQDTTAYAAGLIRADLQKAGINFSGTVIRDDKITGTVIATHNSAPLHDLLHHMLKVSDNLYADMIAKTVGRVYYGEPGNFLNGVSAIKAILRDKAGLNIHNIMVDGSGLSRSDRITANDLYQVVGYIYRHNNTLKILPDLPISGVDGTLHYRRSVQNPPLMGNLVAKTGTLYGTYNIAGLLTTHTGKKLIVVELVTNYPETPNNGASQIPSLMRFEKSYYTALYNRY